MDSKEHYLFESNEIQLPKFGTNNMPNLGTITLGHTKSRSKRRGRALIVCLPLLGLPLPALSAPAAAQDLTAGGTSRVTAVVDGDTVMLENGTEVRLVGIQAPKLPLGRRSFAKWPLADAAKSVLEALALNRTVALRYGGRRQDRHGRALAHLFRDDGLWLQGELLDQGMARVYSFRDNRARIAEMLAHEHAARAARRGIWNHPYYRILSAAETADAIDSFQLVEDRVYAVAVVRGRLYLNFSEDWRSDFTIAAAPRDRALFDREGFDYHALGGSRVRVRGWLKKWNGPMIEITHPEQIEVLQE